MPPLRSIRLRTIALCATLALATAFLPRSAAAGDPDDWVARALLLQEQLDRDAPIAQTLWIGTHNSYNNTQDSVAPDYNQQLSLSNQLRQGVRELVLDVHWYNNELRLCHGDSNHIGCAVEDRRFKAGLHDIHDFLDKHPEAVIFLKIEGEFGKHENRFVNEIEDALGTKYVYTASDAYPGASGCQYLDMFKTTKAAIRKAGKNVIILVVNNKDVCDDKGFARTVFAGVVHEDGKKDAKLQKVKTVSDCQALSAAVHRKELTRVFDSRTKLNVATKFEGSVFLEARHIDGFLSCGLNIFEMFNYKGDKGDMKERFVWSWDKEGSEPSDKGRCAVVNGTTNRFRAVACAESAPAACRKLNGDSAQWCVTRKSAAAQHDALCLAECGTGYEFAAPRNKAELDRLVSARTDKGLTSDVRINYTRGDEGSSWRATLGAN